MTLVLVFRNTSPMLVDVHQELLSGDVTMAAEITATTHHFQRMTEFTVGQRIDEEVHRMIDDQQQIRDEQ